MKQYGAVSDFVQTLVLDLDTSFWSVCHLTVFNGCVIMLLEAKTWMSSTV